MEAMSAADPSFTESEPEPEPAPKPEKELFLIDEERPITVLNAQALAEYLGLPDRQSVLDLLASHTVKDTFEEFHRGCIVPLMEKAQQATRSYRSRAMGFKAVEAAIVSAEHSDHRYASHFQDFASFNTLDWHAWLITTLVRELGYDENGFLSERRNLRPHAKRCMVWTMVSYMKRHKTPSRVAEASRAKENSRKRAARQASRDNTKKRRSGTHSPAFKDPLQPEPNDQERDTEELVPLESHSEDKLLDKDDTTKV